MSRAKLFSSIAPRARLVRPYGRAVAAPPQARAGDRGFSILHRAGPWRDALRRRMIVLADATGVVIAVAVAGELEGGLPFVSGVLLLPIWILLAKLYGLYDRDHRSLRHLTVDELRAIVAWSATATATQVLVLATIGDGGIPASSALALGFAAFVVVAPLRAGARALWRKIVPPDRTLIVGSGTLEQATRRKLELFSDIHARTIGVLDDQLLGDV